jgi:7-cyano-7-deazaguanine synthase in queuosine biosynthesis
MYKFREIPVSVVPVPNMLFYSISALLNKHKIFMSIQIIKIKGQTNLEVPTLDLAIRNKQNWDVG